MFTVENANAILRKHRCNQRDFVHENILSTLSYFNRKVFVNVSRETRYEADRFLEVIFSLMLQDDFSLVPHIEKYLSYTTLIENITFLSHYKTTEPFRNRLLESSTYSVEKVLLLTNAHSLNVELIDSIFKSNSLLGSYWLYALFTRSTFINDTVWASLRCLLGRLGRYDLTPEERICSIFFNATYLDPQNHLSVRRRINNCLEQLIQSQPVINTAAGSRIKRIAVVSKNWYAEHAVYKCIGSFIESLSCDYELTLIQLADDRQAPLAPYFSDRLIVTLKGPVLNCDEIRYNNFNAVIFTDIGLNYESLLLANMRIAPIQIAMYGHPVSTAAREIDYFIVGSAAETAAASNFYAEQLLFIDGPGMNAIIPDYKRPSAIKKKYAQNIIHIFVGSSALKINAVIKHYWKKIVDNSGKKVVLNFLAGDTGMQETSVLRLELERLLGKENIEFHKRCCYAEYMDIVKECDFAIGSYHYGDYNRVIDALWAGIPFIAVRGECGYQNTGSAALSELGLTELIADDLESYVAKSIELIMDDEKRFLLQEKIIRLPLVGTLINNKSYNESFRHIIDQIITAETVEHSAG